MPGKLSPDIACLLDSDVVIDFLRRREYALKLLESWSIKGLLSISTITHLEIYQGVKVSEKEATEAFLDGLTTVVVDVPIARRAGKLLANLRGKGITIGIADSLIAATALELGVPLLTNNIQHYPFKELKVVRAK